MTFKQQNKQKIVNLAHSYFLKEFPLQEIDNNEIRKICKQFRNNLKTQKECLEAFERHFDYFYNWSYVNWMTDVFYFRR